MGRTLLESWNRLSFVARLLTTASCALLVAGAAMVFVSAGQDGRDSRAEIVAELAGELETLPAALAEVVVIGDFSTLQQMLDRYVDRPRVAEAKFIDASGAVIRSQDKPLPVKAPAWFQRWLEFADLTGRAPVTVGGRAYGDLELTMTVQGMANRAWERLLDHLAVLAMAILLDFLGIWLVLRSGLTPLKRLEQGAEDLARGALDTRIESTGSPEMRHVIDAFNHMATATQAAQERTHRAHSDLRRFAEISAHHLMEPARLLTSFSQRLGNRIRGRLEDHEAMESLDFIELEAKRLRLLLRDIQLYLAADQAQGEIVAVDAGHALQVVRASLLAEIDAAEARVEWDEDLPPIRMDEERVRRIFTILLHNALRHGRSDRPLRVRISGIRMDGLARYGVADNGSGIQAQYRDRVFRVFERLSPKPADQSTGVGLSIVRRMAETSGGRAWIDETPGGGTTVFVELPAAS